MSINNALFVGWNRAVAGREFDSLETFAGFTKYLTSLCEEKVIENFEPVMLNQHGGDLNGFILIRGDLSKLHALTARQDWQTWIAKGSFLMENFGVTEAVLGEGVGHRMETFRKVIK